MRVLALTLAILATPALADLPADCRAFPTASCLLTEAEALITVAPAAHLWLKLAVAQGAIDLDPSAALAAAHVDIARIASPDFQGQSPDYEIAALAQLGQFDAAFQALATRPADSGDDHDVAYLTAGLVFQLAKAGFWAEAQSTALTISFIGARNGALVSIAEQQAQAGDIAAAQKIIPLLDYTDPFFADLIAIAIAGGQARLGDLDAALATSAAIPRPGRQAEARIAIALALFELGQTDAAQVVFTDIAAQLPHITDDNEQSRAANVLINALLLTGALDRAEALWDQYQTPTERMFRGALVEAMARHGDKVIALKMLAELQNTDSSRYTPVNVAVAFAEGGDLDSAMTLVLGITTPALQAEALIGIAQVLP